MYPIKKDIVYVMDRVYSNPKAKIRLERMLQVINPKKIIRLNDADLNDLVKQKNWGNGHNKRTGNFHRNGTPDLLFNIFRWNQQEIDDLKQKYPGLNKALFLGQDAITKRNHLNHNGNDWCICQGAFELHSIYGCLKIKFI